MNPTSVTRQMRKYGIPRRSASDAHVGRQAGEKNPAWKGGVTPERQRVYKSREWKALVASVNERDGHRCVRCGSSATPDVRLNTHHLRRWSTYPEGRCDPSNIVTVCEPCHDWIHSRANVGKELLLAG